MGVRDTEESAEVKGLEAGSEEGGESEVIVEGDRERSGTGLNGQIGRRNRK
jgi:hypothetical protein